MKLVHNFFIILIFNLLFFIDVSFSSEKIISLLQEGEKLIFIRHAYAPGNGDPDNFNLKDCKTQRNLNKQGVEQSKKIGNFFNNNNIKIDEILSSEWCRCKDTARIAFKNFKTYEPLNSFYDKKFKLNKLKQISELKEYIKNWNSPNNLVLVTHYVVIYEILDTATSSGEIVISDKKFNILGTIDEM